MGRSPQPPCHWTRRASARALQKRGCCRWQAGWHLSRCAAAKERRSAVIRGASRQCAKADIRREACLNVVRRVRRTSPPQRCIFGITLAGASPGGRRPRRQVCCSLPQGSSALGMRQWVRQILFVRKMPMETMPAGGEGAGTYVTQKLWQLAVLQRFYEQPPRALPAVVTRYLSVASGPCRNDEF